MLDFSRFLNVVYYWAVSHIHDEKERKKFDRELRRVPPEVLASRTEVDEEWVPDWWRGEDAAGQQGLAIARSLGLNVDLSAVGG